MQKSMFLNIPEEERIKMLQDNCDAHEEGEYMRELGSHELDAKREQITQNYIVINDLEDDLAKIKAEYKEKINPLKVENKDLLSQIKHRKQKVSGVLFHFDDVETGIRNTYDAKGEFVSSRRLLPEERQARLFVGPRK